MNRENNIIIQKNKEFWKKKLSDKEYEVLVEGGTERACHNEYYNNKRQGIYICAACNNRLFSSSEKYHSGSGWPSFYDVMSEKAVGTRKDRSLGMERTELYCNRCGGHLGHVFKDGPEPTGLRYCINSNSLNFLQEAYFSMGCFWKPEALFASLEGVFFTEVGYAGGEKENPTYHDLGNHAETVHVIYDPDIIDYDELLEIFWENHNPYREAVSSQYRSLILYNTDEHKSVAGKFIQAKGKTQIEQNKDIQTRVCMIDIFTAAEEYHQKYLLKSNQKLYERLSALYDSKDELNKSRPAAKLNAYSGEFLDKGDIKEELRNHYLYVKYNNQLEEIISEL
ncbi:MAG: peptide-methionine (R)-S-oxide reductase MsrB [Halanaerobiales bacterium]